MLIIRARLVVIALRRRGIAAVVIILLLRLRIGLRIIDAPAARRRIARPVGTAVGRIDIAIVGASLRRHPRLRRELDGIAGSVGLLFVLLGRGSAGDSVPFVASNTER